MNCSSLSLSIKINEQYIVCPRRGGYVKIGRNYTGHLLCPDYNLICSQTVPCNNMFDCVEKGSRMKEDYIYDYTPENVSVQIILPNKSETYEKGYEKSDDGVCPKDCSECNDLRQCFECKYLYYLGVKDGDKNPINFSSNAPKEYYYPKNDSYFFRCIDNCRICKNAYEGYQCDLEYRLDDTHHCVDRIEGCGLYDNSSNSSYFDKDTNNNGTGYRICIECNKDKGYYCFGNNKTACKKMTDDNNTYFNNDLGCKEKWENNFTNCYSCNKTHCNKCKSGYYLNYENKCIEKVEHCQNDTFKSNYSQCDKCV